MKHSLFVEIITVGLFLLMFFNWHKIYVRSQVWIKVFIRRHIIARQDPDLDLDFIPESKVQPTGIENGDPIPDPENKFLTSVNLGGINFTYRSAQENAAILAAKPMRNLNSPHLQQGNEQAVYIDRRPTL